MTPHTNSLDLTPMELTNLARSWLETFYETRDVHAWRAAISIYNDLVERHREAERLNRRNADYIGRIADDLYFELYPWA
jgi:hypothetical protein